jgi:hypothetical protein
MPMPSESQPSISSLSIFWFLTATNRGTRGFVVAARYFYDAQWLPAHCELLFSWNAHVDLMNWGL